MSFDTIQMVRIAKRLVEATGYLELGMTQHTLDRLSDLGEVGPFEADVEMLRGEALRQQHRYADAAVALKGTAVKASSPHSKSAWLAVALWYREAGNADQAIHSLARARGALP